MPISRPSRCGIVNKRPDARPAATQEDKMGRDKLDVAKLLQRHNVIVRGGAEEGRKLLDALVVSSLLPWISG